MPPGGGRGGQQLLLAEAMVAVGAVPGQDDVEALAGLELVDAAQGLQRPVAAKMQIEVGPAPGVHGQAARGGVRRPPPRGPSSTRTRTEPSSTTAERISSWRPAGASSLRSVPGRNASASVTASTPVGLRSWVTSTAVSGSYRWRASTTSSGATTNAPPWGGVEQAAEQRLGVKARKAQPRDAAVEADQRRRRPVTDQAHVLEREIAIAPTHRAKHRISVKHRSLLRLPGLGGSEHVAAAGS
jgi:hypothetical protein